MMGIKNADSDLLFFPFHSTIFPRAWKQANTLIRRAERQLEHHMENLTGGTPPVRPSLCAVTCKLYFTVLFTSLFHSRDTNLPKNFLRKGKR